MKPLTPMKRLSVQFERLNGLITPYFRKFHLNKAERHYNPAEYTYSKGVESDFLLIFRSVKSDASFAFRFNYKDLNAKEHTVEASLKKDDQINYSQALSFADFKERLNLFIRTLENTPRLYEKNVWDAFCATFEIQIQDMKVIIQNAQKEYVASVKDKEKDIQIDLLKKQLNQQSLALQTAIDIVKTKLSLTPEQKLIHDLEKKLKLANQALKLKKDNLLKEHQVPQLEKEVSNASNLLVKGERELDDYKKSLLNQYPNHVSKRIKH